MIKLILLTLLSAFTGKCYCDPHTETVDEYILKMENGIEC